MLKGNLLGPSIGKTNAGFHTWPIQELRPSGLLIVRTTALVVVFLAWTPAPDRSVGNISTLRRSASESGRLRHRDGGHEGGDRRRKVLVLATLSSCQETTLMLRVCAMNLSAMPSSVVFLLPDRAHQGNDDRLGIVFCLGGVRAKSLLTGSPRGSVDLRRIDWK